MEHGHDATLEDAARGGEAAATPVVPFGVLSCSVFGSRRGLEAGEVLWVWDAGGLLALGLCYGQKRQFGELADGRSCSGRVEIPRLGG